MFIDNEKKILNFLQFTPPFFVVLSSLFIIIILYLEHKNNLNHEIVKVKDNFISIKKEEIKLQVEMVEKYIKNSQKQLKGKMIDPLIKQSVINEIKKFQYQKDRYIFIIDYDSKVLVHVNEDLIDKEIFKTSKSQKRKDEIRDIITLAKEGRGYLTYTQFEKPSTNELVDKTSYIVGLNDWQWFIGTGFYHDNINQAIVEKKRSLEIYYQQQLIQSIVIAIASVFVMLLLSFYFSKIVRQKFESYKKEISKNISEKEEYTKLLNQQSKMASIGEMIGNIAHQWRQPLTVISMSANSMKADIDLDEINVNSFQKDINEIVSQTEYLSNTIEDFSNFFKHSNEISKFNLKDAINKTLSLVDVQFKRHKINILMQLEDLYVKGVYNEFIQVLINILNNSKDAFEINECEYSRYISIEVSLNSHINLIIKDNAGGIDEGVIDKVLEPYITTKHQSQGTGIGLYMTNEIIEKHMNGEILIENIDFKYAEEIYKGAQVSIILPLADE